MPSAPFWTLAEERAAVWLRSEGKTCNEIAEAIGRTSDAVRKRLIPLMPLKKHTKQSPWTPELDESLMAAYRDGVKLAAWALEHGRTESSAYIRCLRLRQRAEALPAIGGAQCTEAEHAEHKLEQHVVE